MSSRISTYQTVIGREQFDIVEFCSNTKHCLQYQLQYEDCEHVQQWIDQERQRPLRGRVRLQELKATWNPSRKMLDRANPLKGEHANRRQQKYVRAYEK